MKYLILILSTSLYLTANCQPNKVSALDFYADSIDDLTIYRLETPNKAYKVFIKGPWFSHELLKLDSNNQFKIISQSCTLTMVADSGSWSILSAKRLFVCSVKHPEIYDLVNFKGYIFLVPINKKEEFISDFLKAKSLFNKETRIDIGDRVITNKDFISFSLIERYYCFDPKEQASE